MRKLTPHEAGVQRILIEAGEPLTLVEMLRLVRMNRYNLLSTLQRMHKKLTVYQPRKGYWAAAGWNNLLTDR
jgi:hypothetical protein